MENTCPGHANGLSGYYFTQLVQMLLATHCTIGNPDDYPKDFGNSLKNNEEEFDFVIVGGGSSGSVIGNRLSEMKKWKVLLIESGGDPTFESDIPSFGLSLPGRDLDWKFSTRSTENSCLGMENKTCSVFQGKVLGGTSTINKMHYLRGSPEEYNEWGGNDWTFSNVLNFFKKSEKLDQNFKIVSDADYDELFEEAKKESSDPKMYQRSKIAVGKLHSKTGLLSVNYFAYDFHRSEVKQAAFGAAEELKVGLVGDFNRNPTGFARVMGTIHEGNRGNAAKAFLSPMKDRKNFFLLKNATVQQLIFKGDRVSGVKFVKNGTTQTVTATKEVILSAGAINSPRLLMLSGVGPKQHLEKVGVQVVRDLPGVGQNLQMHFSFFGLPVALKKITKSLSILEKLDLMYQFISRGIGSFGNVGLNDVVGFISTKNDSIPDIQFLHYLNNVKDYYTFNELLISLKIKNEIRDVYNNACSKSGVLLICPTLVRPKSRGWIELTGRNFQNPIHIHPNFLSEEEDLKTLIKGIRLGVKLTQTNAFKTLEPEILKFEIENCVNFKFDSDDYWECLIRYLATSMHDAAGTCRMGSEDDPDAVVDYELKVRGLKGIRVADSSIMPRIVSGSTSVVSMMIGEKVSDFIKKQWTTTNRDEL